jgi:hypothetical protein
MAPQMTVGTEDAEIDDDELIGSPAARLPSRRSDRDIEELYDETSARILQERSDFLLPQIVDVVSKEKWINLRPEYQRRLRWSDEKKSLLIESLLMNIPIPPVFLYEIDLNRYEVMDGQQRLVSILDFYENRLTLRGLKSWPDLNGRTYQQCPPRIRRGLDRRRLSAVVLLAESKNPDEDPTKDIRLQVFDRLNTGGTALNPQELRNCVFRGKFNELIVELGRLRLFNEMIGMPVYEEHVRSDGSISEELQNNYLFKTMGDCQIVLRFFAFRNDAYIRGSIRSMLDGCMRRHLSVQDREINQFRTDFQDRLKVAYQVLGRDAFKLPRSRNRPLSRPLFDAVMISVDRLWDRREELVSARETARREFPSLFEDADAYQIIVGKPNTAEAVKDRINIVTEFFETRI